MKQKGTFYPHEMTYGTTKQFNEKPQTPRFVPKYGPFTRGEPAHVGHNKTFGGRHGGSEQRYEEEREEDKVKY